MAANIDKVEEWQKCMLLLLDEMHIREMLSTKSTAVL